ncbi:MAG: twitching motility protein PilT [Opitutaceae bacterium]|nr:twitching motility protein PilT [Opitutaceae bacterium]
MNRTLFVIRLVFVIVCVLGGWMVSLTVGDWAGYQFSAALIGFLLGILTVLVDVFLKGFSLRGLSAVTFGLAVGSLVAFLIGTSPLFQFGDPQLLYLSRLALFVLCAYLGTVIALRGKDEFQLVIPYVRFVPHEVDVPLVVLDTSALIDGRILKIREANFLPSALIVPQFVLDELQVIAGARDPSRAVRGRKGLEVLNKLRQLPNADIRVVESEVGKGTNPEDKLVYLAQTMKAKLLTTDYTLAQRAQFQGVPWLNLNALSKALHTEVAAGEQFEVDLVKPGREAGQAVGYLADGSMVVVDSASTLVGKRVEVEVVSILPSAGGKIVFARRLEKA